MKKEIKLFLTVLIFSSLLSFLLASYFSFQKGNTAIIPIEGEIGVSSNVFSSAITSDSIISSIKKAETNPNIKVIVFRINSGGGSAVASQEIVSAIKEMNKTSIAWIRDVGASGAYWIASATDYIICNNLSITGSVGVTMSYLEFSKLFDKYGVTLVELATPEHKEIASPYKNLTEYERISLQKMINQTYEFLVEDIAENRNMSVEELKTKSDGGMIFLGVDAKERGLIDYLGGEKELEELIKEKTNLTEIRFVIIGKKSIIESLASQLLSKLNIFTKQSVFLRT